MGVKNSSVIIVVITIDMVLKRDQQTTIAISKRNHFELSGRCRKGQSFDSILTEVLKKVKESEANKAGQSKLELGSHASTV